jgi:hypothetical protein
MCPLTFATLAIKGRGGQMDQMRGAEGVPQAMPILAIPVASAGPATERSLTLRQRRDRRIPDAAGLVTRTAQTDWRHHEPGRHLPAAG